MKKFYLICAAFYVCAMLFASMAVWCKSFAWAIPALVCMAGSGSAAVYIILNDNHERTNK